MRLFRFLIFIALLSTFLCTAAEGQNRLYGSAPAFFPAAGEYISTFDVKETTVSGEVIFDGSIESQEFFGLPDNETPFNDAINRYEIRGYYNPPLYALDVAGDSASAPLSLLFSLDFFDDLGFDPDLIPDTSFVLFNTGWDAGESSIIDTGLITIEIPDTLLSFIDLPAGVELSNELDFSYTLRSTRVDDETFDTPIGFVDAVGFKPNITADITIYLQVFLIGEVPVTFNLLSNYGPTYYFSEEMGLVAELLDPEEIRIQISNPLIDIDQLLTEINGREVLKTSITPNDPVHLPPADAELPELVVLQPNYPNPFNPDTNLRFTLGETAEVEIAAFDIMGREVYRSRYGRMAPGQHTIRFDGGMLSSGTYHYQIRATGGASGQVYVRTSAFTLLK
ncbi:MAG: T9SS type A sorting domain-containing protein [Balneolales bacterium]|nr:T9SS type A sorting domain-containing protein [Balneolales bacterium]